MKKRGSLHPLCGRLLCGVGLEADARLTVPKLLRRSSFATDTSSSMGDRFFFPFDGFASSRSRGPTNGADFRPATSADTDLYSRGIMRVEEIRTEQEANE